MASVQVPLASSFGGRSISLNGSSSQGFILGLGGFRVLGRVYCAASRKDGAKPKAPKENVWSIDLREEPEPPPAMKKEKQKKRIECNAADEILASKMFTVDQQKVLQEEEVILSPLWKTFASNNRGVWKGVGAVFSPDTSEMQPIGLGDKDEELYDCRLVNFVDTDPETETVHREVLWNAENKEGELGANQFRVQDDTLEQEEEEELNAHDKEEVLDETSLESFTQNEEDTEAEDAPMTDELEDWTEEDASVTEGELEDWTEGEPEEQGYSSEELLPEITSKYSYEGMNEVMEKDSMAKEPGLLFFEDGSYSRGPDRLLSSEAVAGFHTPILKIEQCLVRGGHKRARIVHTLLVDEETEEVQVVRLAVYEEEWTSPIELTPEAEESQQLLLSQRPRTNPRELTGRWKVFEVNACLVREQQEQDGEAGAAIYACKEFSRKKRLPKITEEFEADMLWLPGGYFAYTHLEELSGKYSIGIGWYCAEDGTVLTMHRSYSPQGELLQVALQTEIRS